MDLIVLNTDTQGEMDGDRSASVLNRSSSVMSMGSPTRRRVTPGLSRSQSYNIDVEHEATEEMIAERDAKIRELEDTVRMLKEKLSVCDDEPSKETEEDNINTVNGKVEEVLSGNETEEP